MSHSLAPADELQDLAAAQRGDHQAFTRLVRSTERLVHGYLRARLTGGGDVDDLCQEVFLRVYTGRAAPRDMAATAVRPWLVGIARNVLREHVRRLKQRREHGWTELCLEIEGQDDAAGEHGPDYDEALSRLPACLESLGPSARQAIELYYRSDLRMREIAERFKRTEGAIKLLVHRARLALKRCLDASLPGELP